MSEPEQKEENTSEPLPQETAPKPIHYQLLADQDLENIAAGFADTHQTSCLGSGSMTTSG